jgi:cysteine desulfurase
MHDVAASTRSACSSGSSEPSHVLTAMGVAAPDAFASVRFSLGRATTEADIDHAVAKATEAYARVLALRN